MGQKAPRERQAVGRREGVEVRRTGGLEPTVLDVEGGDNAMWGPLLFTFVQRLKRPHGLAKTRRDGPCG